MLPLSRVTESGTSSPAWAKPPASVVMRVATVMESSVADMTGTSMGWKLAVHMPSSLRVRAYMPLSRVTWPPDSKASPLRVKPPASVVMRVATAMDSSVADMTLTSMGWKAADQAPSSPRVST